jgi:4-amino-4-deoxy-L-arabinose transferase-like glycosyltransferase
MATITRQVRSINLPSWRVSLIISLPFLASIGLRVFFAPLNRMPFNSDEALFLLKARHILAGQWPLFMYGEVYGGTIDSYLTAPLFYLFGPSIIGPRLVVQNLEYLLGMTFTYLLARRVLPDSRLGPLAVLWLMAIPPILMMAWIVPTLRYTIIICLGSIIAYLGHRLLKEDADRPVRWLLFGLVCGLAFWTFGILVVYMLPLFILFLFQFRRQRWPSYLLAAIAFILASLPWWSQALTGLTVIYNPDNPATIPSLYVRLFAFLTIMLPAFIGIRPPWQAEIIWPVLSAAILLFYLAVFLYTIPRLRRNDPEAPTVDRLGFALLALQVLIWCLLYFSTRFSSDATGRYIFPLYLVLPIAAALLLERLYRWRRPVALFVLAAVLAFNLATHLWAIQTMPPGLTTQMSPDFWYGNHYDQALIDFLADHGDRGYSHHWISYKIAFLSDEQVILSALLPYSPPGPGPTWNNLPERYPPYQAAVEASPTRVYVTHREPHLESYLRQAFNERGITYQIQDIGPYRVYYDFSAVITPQEIGFE